MSATDLWDLWNDKQYWDGIANNYKRKQMTMNTDKQEQHAKELSFKLGQLFDQIQPFLANRDAHYESSWKRRGGVGAMLTIARPWDRFEAIAQRKSWDIFKVLQEEIDQGKDESHDGTLHACIRDLLCYMALLLVEAKTMRRVYKPDIPQTAEAVPFPKEPMMKYESK